MALPRPTPAVTEFGSFAGLRASAKANDPAALRQAAQQFEALFTQTLLKSARSASLSDDVMGGGQTGFYQDLFDQQMALHLSTQGKGMGLADLMVRQMQHSLPSPASPGSPRSSFSLRGVDGRGVGGEGVAAVDAASASATHALSRRSAPPSPARGGGEGKASHNDFIQQIRPHAERAARELGIPSHVILAQAAMETGWGRHVPHNADGSSSFNFFGIKAAGDWDGARVDKTTHEHLGGGLRKVSASFRAYGSVGEAFDDYVRFLKDNPRYASALQHGGDPARFAHGLQKAGYATDPDYAGKLLKVAHGRTMTAALATTAAPVTWEA